MPSAVTSTDATTRGLPFASSIDRCFFITPESRKAMPTPEPSSPVEFGAVAGVGAALPPIDRRPARSRVFVVTRSAEMLATSARWVSTPIWFSGTSASRPLIET